MLARWPGRSYDSRTLNESPSEKEGKSSALPVT